MRPQHVVPTGFFQEARVCELPGPGTKECRAAPSLAGGERTHVWRVWGRFVGGKVPCPYGPSAGDEGFVKNVEFFKKWRETVGPEYPLMLDCYMALTVPYTIKLAKALEPYNLKWIEECLPPDDYDGYEQVPCAWDCPRPPAFFCLGCAVRGLSLVARGHVCLGPGVQIKRSIEGMGIMVTTAEHEYTRYGYRELIKRKAVDVLQPDITWLGGITEARRVVAMAAAYDILVVPHGSSVYSYHLQASQERGSGATLRLNGCGARPHVLAAVALRSTPLATAHWRSTSTSPPSRTRLCPTLGASSPTSRCPRCTSLRRPAPLFTRRPGRTH